VPTKIRKAKAKAKRPQPRPAAPRHHHLDRRAHQILAADNGADDELLTTQQVAQWFGVSEQWLEIGRSRGYGPSFVMLAARTIRYRRSDCREYLAARVYSNTAEYRSRGEKGVVL
jgi:predicted DNA-binding transcriptional regulator AlpA